MTRNNLRKLRPFNAAQEQPAQAIETRTLSEPMRMIEAEIPVNLADKKFELTRLKEQVEADLAEIDRQLKEQLHDGEVVSTHHGVGYRLMVASQDVYDKRAIRELSRMKLLPRFVRVSTTRLRELVNEGKISQKKFNALREFATARHIATLREVPLAETQTG